MEWQKKIVYYMKKIIVVAIVIGLVTMFSFVLYSMGIRAENILMVYTFGILIIIMETKRYEFGIVSAFVMVALFNYFFTEPRFTLRVYDKNYLISFIIFLIVSVIVTSLTIKIQKQVQELEETQRFTNIMYEVSSGYLHVSGLKQVAKYGIECLENIHQCRYIIFVNEGRKNKRIPYSNFEEQIPNEIMKAAEWSYKQSSVCGKGTGDYPCIDYYMMPIVSKGITFGVLAMENETQPVRNKEKQILDSIVSIIAMAMDRECANEAEQESKLASEREHLRNNLLRSISHDLRTPLAGITGSASFLMESYEEIDKDSRETLLKDITNDSIWLARMVDNLLNMTRIQEGKLKIHYEEEVVDDIVSEVNSRVQRRLGSRRLLIKTPAECLSVPMDGQLIIQVLVNLVENSIKHTNNDGTIHLEVEKIVIKEKGNAAYAKFAVEDDGTGIAKEIQERMFESFVTSDTEKGADCGRGMGLGLSIASEIVKVHNGMIGSYNNHSKGATVYFLIPMERGK